MHSLAYFLSEGFSYKNKPIGTNQLVLPAIPQIFIYYLLFIIFSPCLCYHSRLIVEKNVVNSWFATT